MFRTDEQVAINEVLIRLHHTADHYADAAEAITDSSAAEKYRNDSAACRALVDELAGLIRSSGELPPQPDPDREFLEQAITRLSAGVSPEDKTIFAEALANREAAVVEAADSALAMTLPADIETLVRQIKNGAVERRQDLS